MTYYHIWKLLYVVLVKSSDEVLTYKIPAQESIQVLHEDSNFENLSDFKNWNFHEIHVFHCSYCGILSCKTYHRYILRIER